MMRFRKRPIEVEAIKFTYETQDRVYNWIAGNRSADRDGEGKPTLHIQTLEGVMTATLGDWIIRGVAGEFYPCKPEVFVRTYEPVEEESR